MIKRATTFCLCAIIAFGTPSCSAPESETTAEKAIVAGSGSEDSGRGGLLLTRFKSLDQLKTVVTMRYFREARWSGDILPGKGPQVQLEHSAGGYHVRSELHPGINEGDFLRARDGSFWDRARIAWISPFAVNHRMDLLRIEILARRRYEMFGEGDIAFYDLAETMVYHITDRDVRFVPAEDLSEKGYLNTFNHITAQAFITTLFSEDLADFVADVHERYRMPELITGNFSEDQLTDLEDGALDNYIDIINNEWGHELGKELKAKYRINAETKWTPELLASYLNAIQDHNSWAFNIGFEPFTASDPLVVRFANKINIVRRDARELRKYYF